MDFLALQRDPSPPLSRFVESFWFARGRIPYRRELIAPTGSTVFALNFGSPIRQTPYGTSATTEAVRGFLLGPHDRPLVNEPTAETHTAVVVLRPTACAAVLGVAPAPLRGRAVELDEHWPHAAAARERLRHGLDDPEVLLADLEALLTERLDPAVPGLERCERAVALLEADPARPVAEVADDVGWSHPHLVRRFSQVVGLTPRRLAAIARTRRLLADLDVFAEPAWGDLAAQHGWYDQSHLIRDFKRHTGVTPSAYIRAQRRHFGPGEVEPGFVPETDDDQIRPRQRV